jgi:hypothetical protein
MKVEVTMLKKTVRTRMRTSTETGPHLRVCSPKGDRTKCLHASAIVVQQPWHRPSDVVEAALARVPTLGSHGQSVLDRHGVTKRDSSAVLGL